MCNDVGNVKYNVIISYNDLQIHLLQNRCSTWNIAGFYVAFSEKQPFKSKILILNVLSISNK